MRKIMTIPTCWCRKTGDPRQEGDAVYDHPTPVDQEGTLERMTIMQSTGFWRNAHGGFCQQMKRRSAGRAAPDRRNGRREGSILLRRANTVKNRSSKN